MSKYRLKLIRPKAGRIEVPTALVTVVPFRHCPSCEADRSEETRLRVVFACGMEQRLTEEDEYAVISCCPYAMAAVNDLRSRRTHRGDGVDGMGLDGKPVVLPYDGYQAGDKVRWISQSAGKETVKKGVVVSVVPPDKRPEDFIPDGMRKNSTNGYGRSRPHTTYLVSVSGKGSMVYWPRVHCLERL